MNNFGVLFINLIFLGLICKFTLLKFKPSKSKEIYDIRWCHRGWHFYFPENTMAAFKEPIIKEKKWGIELDVRYLEDGEIVCFHDFYTNRLLNVPGTIKKFSYNELRNYKILDSQEIVPKLEDALNYFKGEIPVLIEVKG